MNPYNPQNPNSPYAPPAPAPQGYAPPVAAPGGPPQGYAPPAPQSPAGYAPPPAQQPQGYAPQGYPPSGATPPTHAPAAPAGYVPPVTAPAGYTPPQAAPNPLYGRQAGPLLMGAGHAQAGINRLPRVPLGGHTFEVLATTAKVMLNDTNFIARLKFLQTTRDDLIASGVVVLGQTECVWYQSLRNAKVAPGVVKGFFLPLLGYQSGDKRFDDPELGKWLDQQINEASQENPETGEGFCTVGGTWEHWGTNAVRLVQLGTTSLVGKHIRCDSNPQKKDGDKKPGQIDVFGDRVHGRQSFYPV